MKSLIKKLMAKYRLLTSGSRALPDFLIIGAQKAGTTSLYEYLKKHPDLKSNYTVKELNFFNEKFNKGLNWYRSNFPIQKPGKLYYEASPYYLFNPNSPKRVFDTLPNAKLILILRNPVERAFSHYQHQKRAGRETLSFEEAVVKEEERLAGEEQKMLANPEYQSYNHRKFSYIERGKYSIQLKRWFEYFKQDQILVIESSELWNTPDKIFEQIFKFLGVKDIKIDIGRVYNSGNYEKEMSKELRQHLENIFQPYNDELYDLIGKNYNW